MTFRLNLVFFRDFDHIDVISAKMHNCMYSDLKFVTTVATGGRVKFSPVV